MNLTKRPSFLAVAFIVMVTLCLLAANPTFQSFNIYRFFVSGTGSSQVVTIQDGFKLIQEFGAVGDGVTDDTVAISNACASGLNILFTNRTYVVSATSYPTNYTCLKGYNTRFLTPSGSTMTNQLYVAITCSNVIIDGITFDGNTDTMTGHGDFDSGGTLTRPWNYLGAGTGAPQGFTNMIVIKQSGTIRNGVTFCSSQTNSSIVNCQFNNFTGVGLLIQGSGVASPQPQNHSTVFNNLSFNNDFIGLSTTNYGEYVNLVNTQASACGTVASVSSGNDLFSGGLWQADGIGINLINGSNPAHGHVADVIMNHSDFPIVGNGWNTGQLFTGCLIIGSGRAGSGNMIILTNVAGLDWSSGFNDATGIICDGTGGGGNNRIAGLMQGYPTLITTNGGLLELACYNYQDAAAHPLITNTIYNQVLSSQYASVTNAVATSQVTNYTLLFGSTSIKNYVTAGTGNVFLKSISGPPGDCTWLIYGTNDVLVPTNLAFLGATNWKSLQGTNWLFQGTNCTIVTLSSFVTTVGNTDLSNIVCTVAGH